LNITAVHFHCGCPVQVAIATIVDDAIPYAQEVKAELEKRGCAWNWIYAVNNFLQSPRTQPRQSAVIIALGSRKWRSGRGDSRLGSQKQELWAGFGVKKLTERLNTGMICLQSRNML